MFLFGIFVAHVCSSHQISKKRQNLQLPSRPRIFSHSKRSPLPHHLQHLQAPSRSPPPHHFRSFRQSHLSSRLHRTRLRPGLRRSRRPRRCLEIPEPRPPSRRHRHSPPTRSPQGHGLRPTPLPLLKTRPQRRRTRHAARRRLRPPSRRRLRRGRPLRRHGLPHRSLVRLGKKTRYRDFQNPRQPHPL